MLTYACSRSRPNAIIERTNICILAWKLHFSSAAAAGAAPRPPRGQLRPGYPRRAPAEAWERRWRGHHCPRILAQPRHVPQEEDAPFLGWRAVFQTDPNVAPMRPPSPWSPRRKIQHQSLLSAKPEKSSSAVASSPRCWRKTMLSQSAAWGDLLLPIHSNDSIDKISVRIDYHTMILCWWKEKLKK